MTSITLIICPLECLRKSCSSFSVHSESDVGNAIYKCCSTFIFMLLSVRNRSRRCCVVVVKVESN